MNEGFNDYLYDEDNDVFYAEILKMGILEGLIDD